MYYDTIYARCANGYDLEKRCEQHNSGGYKVHGFSREMLSDDKVDIPYLLSILQKTIPADKEKLTDDGFFYSAADTGSRFLTRFHYVTDAFRNFFITQAYVGGYEDFYPFELFMSDDLWYAKDQNEEYYLSADTAYPPTIASPAKQGALTIQQDAVRFIADGRKQVFKQALAFIISQYELPRSQRKYLIIKDKTEKEIEYWIAALSLAVSPRMASELTFATRMEAIQNTNRYAVDKNGRYTKGMDFQSAPDSLRRIAMIVGVVDADRDNADIAIRASSPFVILDGATKTLSEAVDDSHRYYDHAASFSNVMLSFCGSFVQAFGYTSPTKDILELFDLYATLAGGASESAYASALQAVLSRPIVRKENLEWLYEKTKKMFSEGEHKDLGTLIALSEGLKKLSAMFGGFEDKEIEDRILGAFENVLFKGNNQDRESWWSILRRSQFAEAAAKLFASSETIEVNMEALNKTSSANLAKVIDIYLDMQSILGKGDYSLTESLCTLLFEKCRITGDNMTAKQIVNSVDRVYGSKDSEIWNKIIEKNDANSSFLIGVMYPENGPFPEDVSKLMGICSRLHQNGDTNLAEQIIMRTINNATEVGQIKDLMNKLKKEPFFAAIDKDAYYRLIDSRIGYNMKDRDVPYTIQKEKPAKTACPNSAHVVALDKLRAMRRTDSVEELLQPYFAQGFPCLEIAAYINELCTTVVRSKHSASDSECIVKKMLESKTVSYYCALFVMLYEQPAKKADLWTITISAAASEKMQEIKTRAFNTIVEALARQRASKSAMDKAGKYISDKAAWQFYMDAVAEVLNRRTASKPKMGGFFGGLFGKKTDK